MLINLIVAGIVPEPSRSCSRVVIAVDGKMPWNEPSDLAYFKRMTTGCAVVCGRKTFDVMPKLEGRDTYVVSRTMVGNDSVTVVPNLESACAKVEAIGHKTLWIIGGGEIYHEAISNPNIHIDYVSFTEINGCPIPDGEETVIDLARLMDKLNMEQRESGGYTSMSSVDLSTYCTAHLMKSMTFHTDLFNRFVGRK